MFLSRVFSTCSVSEEVLSGMLVNSQPESRHADQLGHSVRSLRVCFGFSVAQVPIHCSKTSLDKWPL